MVPSIDYENSLEYARRLDEGDVLHKWRSNFHIPRHKGREAVYFCGNSLGLQPKGVAGQIDNELQQWRELAVEGWFDGKHPWLSYHKRLQSPMADIVGARAGEVIVMNTLTVNLHLLMVSFYRPERSRYKIIMEAGAFPSDQYAVASQVRHHGFDPEEAIIEVAPREGEVLLRTEDILKAIERAGHSLSLVMLGGVNYYTGQYYDLHAITQAAHKVGAYAGFDLAHGAGNVPMQLHDWDVDFAVWCTYKYLNSGPGGPGGAFIHQRHGKQPDLPRFAGWWGHDEQSRFLMQKGFKPIPGAAGWQISTAQVLSWAPLLVSLQLFEKAGMDNLREKSERLTAYLAWQLQRLQQQGKGFRILTPDDPAQRGCQLSIYVTADGKALFDHLTSEGVIGDWREDNLFGSGGGVIRVAPTPLYNTFEEVYRFAELLERYA